MTTVAEIEQAIEQLPPEQVQEVVLWLSKRENKETIPASPEMLAAIDEGIHSAQTEPRVTIEEARQKVRQCIRELK